MFQGVLFDLDGIITDTARFHFKAWRQLAADELGIELPASFEAELKGVSRLDSLRRILKFAQLTDRYSDSEINRLATLKNQRYQEEIAQLTRQDILPGIEALLAELKAHQIKLSVASASKNAPFILKKLGLFEQFDAIADPAQVAHGKPAPDIFIEAARQVELTPAQCVGIEDAVAGVTAIKAAGAPAVAVGDAAELAQADVIVPSTASLTYAVLMQAIQK